MLDFPEKAASPAAPSAGRSLLYPKADGFWYYKDDAGNEVRFCNAGSVLTSGLTMATARLLGRTTAGTGAIEEISVGSGLSLAGGSLSATVQSPTYRKNAIINGDFNVWQRGTSFAAAAAGAYTADRWRYNKTGAMVHTVAQSSDVPTVAQAGRLFNYSLHVDCTTVDAAIAAGDFAFVGQRIEGFNWLPLAQRAIVLSFWVKGTKTGTHCISLTNDVDRSYIGEYTINVTATWEFKTVTLSASPSAGTWNYTTGVGAHLIFALAVGSTYQTTANAWNTGLFFGTANQVNACDNIANDFRICGVQLEQGSTATEIEYMSFPDNLALCQRYFEKTFPYATAPAQNATYNGALSSSSTGTSASGESLILTWNYTVQKRVTATITRYSPADATSNFYAPNGPSSIASADGLGSEHGAVIYANGAPSAAAKAYYVQAVADAEL